MSRPDYFDTINKDKDPYRSRNKIITMYKGIGQQLFENDPWNLRATDTVYSLVSLNMRYICEDKTQCLLENIGNFWSFP